MQVSLMTLSMFIRIFYQYFQDRNMEQCLEQYDDMLRATKAAGFDTVEVTSRETGLVGVASVHSALKRHGLTVGGYMYVDSLDQEAGKLRDAVVDAETLGADTLMLIPSWHSSLEGRSRNEIHRFYAERWREAVGLAAEKGITVVVEDTPDQRLSLCRAEDIRHFLSLLPSVRLVYDSGNMILAGEEPVAYAREMKDEIACVHLKDMKLVPAGQRGADLALDGRCMSSARHGEGLIPLPEVIQTLLAQGYDGRWVVELSVERGDTYPGAVSYAYGWICSALHIAEEE